MLESVVVVSRGWPVFYLQVNLSRAHNGFLGPNEPRHAMFKESCVVIHRFLSGGINYSLCSTGISLHVWAVPVCKIFVHHHIIPACMAPPCRLCPTEAGLAHACQRISISPPIIFEKEWRPAEQFNGKWWLESTYQHPRVAARRLTLLLFHGWCSSISISCPILYCGMCWSLKSIARVKEIWKTAWRSAWKHLAFQLCLN